MGRHAKGDGKHLDICAFEKRVGGVWGHCMVVSGYGDEREGERMNHAEKK